MKQYFHLIICLLFPGAFAMGATVNQDLYINADSLSCVDSLVIPYKAFNPTTNYEEQNVLITINVGDELDLWVINNDTIPHGFAVNNVGGNVTSIPPGDSANVVLTFANAGVYIYHDPLDMPVNTYLGLGGMIVVKDHQHASFYWNLKDHQGTWNDSIVNGGTVNWLDYNPDLFTINGNSNPNINADPQARITGSVGDTLILHIANTGRGIHSLHLHGYHGTVLYSSKYPAHVGRSKDTMPVYPMETVVLQIIPDKPGEYPVHDHNLVAVSGNGYYPNGMFSTILILP